MARGLEDDLPPLEDDLERPEAAVDGSENGAAGFRDESARAAGGVVVVRATEAGPRVAVLECGGFVSLPRAEVGPGESAETAARRAGLVFLGARVRLVETIGETHDEQDGDEVLTWFWLARARRPALLQPSNPPPPGFTVHWLDVEEAADALDSDEERDLLEQVGRRALPRRRRIFASGEHRALCRDLESLRDTTVADAQSIDEPERLEALERARFELARAEDRLARGDDGGARRAHARAERESLAALDERGRTAALRRGLARLTADERAALGLDGRVEEAIVPFELLLAVQRAVEAAGEERARRAVLRRAAQARATIALAATVVGVAVIASLGIFRPAPEATGTHGSELLAAVYLVAGALGGWVAEALGALRTLHRSREERAVALPLAAAAGGVAGLALGALLSGGLAGIPAGTNAAVTVAGAFAAGCVGRRAVQRGD